MFKYKNISKQELFVPKVGSAKPGEELESVEELNNPRLELVKKSKPMKPIKPTKSRGK